MYCIGNKPVHNKILINKLRMEGKQHNRTQYQDQWLILLKVHHTTFTYTGTYYKQCPGAV